jgi:hypothetical protein
MDVLVTPLPANTFALIVPEPDTPRLPPVPTTIEAVVFVALVIAENAGVLVPQTPPPDPSARQVCGEIFTTSGVRFPIA